MPAVLPSGHMTGFELGEVRASRAMVWRAFDWGQMVGAVTAFLRGGLLSSPTPDRRPVRLPVARAAMLALVLLAVLAGCGLPEGPLGKRPENHQTVGEPVRQGGAATIGWDGFFNGGPAPAVIDRLVVVSPRHIKLIGAYVTIGGPVGNWVTFPPSFPRSARGRRESRYAISRWANRHKIAGAVIPPHRWAGIALGLEATSAHGSIAGIDVFYHVGDAHYEWHGHVRIVLTSVNCRAPSSAPARNFCSSYFGHPDRSSY